MLVVLIITALFVALSVYFFFRAEKLQHSLLVLKRETSNNLKQSTALTESIALIASNQEGFAKNRLQKLLDNKEHQRLGNIELIKPLINNYLIIFNECLKGKGKLQGITKQCFDNQSTCNYNDFINEIIKNDASIRRLWASNNLIGFVSLVEALLVKYDVTEECNASTQSKSA